jgi:hypothetical protein
MKAQKVFVVRYSHKYGHDIGVYSTSGKAEGAIFDIMSDNFTDFLEGTMNREDRTKMRRGMTAARKVKALGAALLLWEEGTDQYFEIYERTVS